MDFCFVYIVALLWKVEINFINVIPMCLNYKGYAFKLRIVSFIYLVGSLIRVLCWGGGAMWLSSVFNLKRFMGILACFIDLANLCSVKLCFYAHWGVVPWQFSRLFIPKGVRQILWCFLVGGGVGRCLRFQVW